MKRCGFRPHGRSLDLSHAGRAGRGRRIGVAPAFPPRARHNFHLSSSS